MEKGRLEGRNLYLEVRELLKERGRSLVLLLVLLAALVLVGCGGSETKVTADEVVNDTLAAQADVTSSSTEFDMKLSWNGTKNSEAVVGSVQATGNVDVDQANKKMYARPTITISVAPINIQPTIDFYAVNTDEYLQVTLVNQSRGWAKDTADSDLWQSFASYQSNLLNVMTPEYLGKEKLNGVSCHKLKMTPNWPQIQAMLAAQSSGDEQPPNLEELVDSTSITVWVVEKTSLLAKVDMTIDMTIPKETLATTPVATYVQVDGALTAKLTLTAEFSNYNEAPAIVVPDAAKAATDSFSVYFGKLLGSFMVTG